VQRRAARVVWVLGGPSTTPRHAHPVSQGARADSHPQGRAPRARRHTLGGGGSAARARCTRGAVGPSRARLTPPGGAQVNPLGSQRATHSDRIERSVQWCSPLRVIWKGRFNSIQIQLHSTIGLLSTSHPLVSAMSWFVFRSNPRAVSWFVLRSNPRAVEFWFDRFVQTVPLPLAPPIVPPPTAPGGGGG